jgi:hypothetical protein
MLVSGRHIPTERSLDNVGSLAIAFKSALRLVAGGGKHHPVRAALQPPPPPLRGRPQMLCADRVLMTRADVDAAETTAVSVTVD